MIGVNEMFISVFLYAILFFFLKEVIWPMTYAIAMITNVICLYLNIITTWRKFHYSYSMNGVTIPRMVNS